MVMKKGDKFSFALRTRGKVRKCPRYKRVAAASIAIVVLELVADFILFQM